LVQRTTIMTLMRLGPQVQEIVVDLHTVQCGNIPATRRLEIFTFLIKSRHRSRVRSKWMGLLWMWCVAAAARKGD